MTENPRTGSSPAPLPSSLSARLRQRARTRPARVVLPEGGDPRVVQAAAAARREGIAQVVLLGAPGAIAAAARAAGANLERVACADPAADPRLDKLAARYCDARRSDSTGLAAARAILADPIVFGTMLVESGEADGLVAGACATTGATIEPALRVRRLTPGQGPVTSCFLMEIPPGRLAAGRGDVLVFADCALNPDPSPMMLARIAIAAARAARELCEMEPVVALLSSSSHGSASHERVLAVRQAVAEVRRRAPDLCVDGELQADAALVAAVGERKAPGSRVAGRANVLVFPDLESGNIGYKLVERLAGARAIGPVFSGLGWPVNDLSRGCSVDDILDVVAVTSIQASAAAG
jgi:phosphate acetyltransferase